MGVIFGVTTYMIKIVERTLTILAYTLLGLLFLKMVMFCGNAMGEVAEVECEQFGYCGEEF